MKRITPYTHYSFSTIAPVIFYLSPNSIEYKLSKLSWSCPNLLRESKPSRQNAFKYSYLYLAATHKLPGAISILCYGTPRKIIGFPYSTLNVTIPVSRHNVKNGPFHSDGRAFALPLPLGGASG